MTPDLGSSRSALVPFEQERDRRHRRVSRILDDLASTTDPDQQRQLENQVVLEHRTVAQAIAARYLHRGIDRDDLEQLAALGLIKAARRWRPGLCTDFLQYAVPTMTGEIRRHFRDHSATIRPTRRLQQLRADLVQFDERGLEDSDQVLADRWGVTIPQVREARHLPDLTHPVSLSCPVPDGAGQWSDIIGQEDLGYAAAEDRLLLQLVFSALTDQERLVVRLRFWDDLSQADIGTRIGVSQMQVSRILRRITAKAQQAVNGQITARAG